MRQSTYRPLLFVSCFLVACTINPRAFSAEIDACKYLAVRDFTSDPHGIASELRTQARQKGFTVINSPSELPADERLKACVMAGSWSIAVFSGTLSVRVTDAISGARIGEATISAGSVRGGVRKVYKELHYAGYSETAFQERMRRLYPPRPQLSVTEAQIRTRKPRNQIEGIWADRQNQYRLGIVRAPKGINADYVAVVLESNSPLWHPGEIKVEFNTTAFPITFTCTYYLSNKKPVGTTLTVQNDRILGYVDQGTERITLDYLRVWPNGASEEPTTTAPGKATEYAGTGFLLNRSGLIATNWHVVSGAKRITASFPNWTAGASAEIVLKDMDADLAIIRLTDLTLLKDTCRELPFQVTSSKSVALGQRVSTIGYPYGPMLGSEPKFSDGVISSKSGLKDDPRAFQISAPIQPGSSGSPLFDADGNVIGVVFSQVDEEAVFSATGTLPQNVNFAVKSDYLLKLFSTLPTEQLATRTAPFSPEGAAGCVAMIHVWEVEKPAQ